MAQTHRQTYTRTWRLYDQLGPVGPSWWKSGRLYICVVVRSVGCLFVTVATFHIGISILRNSTRYWKEWSDEIFTNSAPLGRAGHRVAMSVCVCVCLCHRETPPSGGHIIGLGWHNFQKKGVKFFLLQWLLKRAVLDPSPSKKKILPEVVYTSGQRSRS